MNILAVDDESLQLDKLMEAIKEVLPDSNVVGLRRPSQALMYAEEHEIDVAFLDVQMRGITGVELARLIIRLQPRINIIFVTAYNDFKADAMDLHASGYITKPVNANKISNELQHLRYPVQLGLLSQEEESSMTAVNHPTKVKEEKKPLIYVQCFGNFDVYDSDHNPIRFERTKAKELLAYLIFKRGSRCTNRELVAVLFENEAYSTKIQDSFRHITSAMMKALRKVNAEEVVIRDHQNYAVNIKEISCDYYDFIEEDPSAQSKYTGEFMSQYSWAEYIHAYLDSKIELM